MVLWSGGCDSTLVLIERLRKTPDRAVTVIYKAKHHPETYPVPHTSFQLETMQKLTSAMQRLGGFRHNFVTFEYDWQLSSAFQPVMWLTAAHQIAEEEESIVTGWCKGDDALRFWPNLVALLDNMNSCTGKRVKLEAPLQYTDKWETIRRLRVEGVYDMCRTCERNTPSPCGACVPCRTRKAGELMADWLESKSLCGKEVERADS